MVSATLEIEYATQCACVYLPCYAASVLMYFPFREWRLQKKFAIVCEEGELMFI